MRGLAGALMVLVLLAGCAVAPDERFCVGDRSRLAATLPGLRTAMQGIAHDPLLRIHDQPLADRTVSPLEAGPLHLPEGWDGALLTQVGWSLAPPVTVERQYRIPDGTKGGLWLNGDGPRPALSGQLPAAWTSAQRAAGLEAFLANTTTLDAAGRQALVAQAKWIPGDGAAAFPVEGDADPPLVQLDIPPEPLEIRLAPRLADVTAWNETSGQAGYRQVLIDGYDLNFSLPVTVASWVGGTTEIELSTDAEGKAVVWVFSQGHDEAAARRMANATLLAAGWSGTLPDWDSWHEDGTGSIEHWRAACREDLANV